MYSKHVEWEKTKQQQQQHDERVTKKAKKKTQKMDNKIS